MYGGAIYLSNSSMKISNSEFDGNIAEGSAKPTDIDFARFLDQALGSAYEVETQLIISHNVGYISDDQCDELTKQNRYIQKQLVALIRNIRHPKESS